MFDLGLTKMALIGVVALLVIGPKDLPKVARMAGSLLGRAQRYINDVKSEVGREMELEELRKMQAEVQAAAQGVEQSITQEFSEAQQHLNEVWGGNDAVPIDAVPNAAEMTAHYSTKVKDFRRKKLLRQSALPAWYKNQQGRTQRVVSGAARMARFRVVSKAKSSFF
jgi:sec-independent protein translocase protein TatB